MDSIPVEIWNPVTDFGYDNDIITSAYGNHSYSSYCIPAGKYNITLNSNTGDLKSGWSNIHIFVNKCNPQTETCRNQTILDEACSNLVQEWPSLRTK